MPGTETFAVCSIGIQRSGMDAGDKLMKPGLPDRGH
jgi:hypothetical protein